MAEVRSAILGTGRAYPQGILTNADLERMVETSDEWITTRTGIKERHRASEAEYTSMFAVAGVAPGHRARAHRPPGDRPRHLRHRLARPDSSLDRLSHPGRAGRAPRRRLRPRRRLLRLPLRPDAGRQDDQDGAGALRARHRRRGPVALRRFHRPLDLHPLRRRCGRGRARAGRRGARRARHQNLFRRPLRRAALLARRRHAHQADGRDALAGLALLQDEGQRAVQDRRAFDGGRVASRS